MRFNYYVSQENKAIHALLLKMGMKQQRKRMKARREYMITGDKESRSALIEASLLLCAICQLAEFMEISAYSAFEAKILGKIT